MSIMRYFKYRKWSILHVIIIEIIVNLVMISSNSLNKTIYDILYMNVLILSVSFFFLIFGYMRWNSNYKDIKDDIQSDNDIDGDNLREGTFELELIKDILKLKDDKAFYRLEKLHKNIDDTNDYITKWVHEIKIPISVCELLVEQTGEELDLEDMSRNSHKIRREIERIKFLVDQVMYTNRACSYAEDLSVQETNLERVVKDVVKKNSYFFISKKINLILGELNFNVMTDKKWISYILDQLLNNSCKYVGENGEVEICAESDDKEVRLSVKDNGIGIMPKDIERIFDRGFTGENGRVRTTSTGMGLYICKTMLDRLSHRLEVQSKVGEYTEFKIVFYELSDYFHL